MSSNHDKESTQHFWHQSPTLLQQGAEAVKVEKMFKNFLVLVYS